MMYMGGLKVECNCSFTAVKDQHPISKGVLQIAFFIDLPGPPGPSKYPRKIVLCSYSFHIFGVFTIFEGTLW
jgi:hypothetical protein